MIETTISNWGHGVCLSMNIITTWGFSVKLRNQASNETNNNNNNNMYCIYGHTACVCTWWVNNRWLFPFKPNNTAWFITPGLDAEAITQLFPHDILSGNLQCQTTFSLRVFFQNISRVFVLFLTLRTEWFESRLWAPGFWSQIYRI